MKVAITFNVDDRDRAVIGERYGKSRADYQLVRSWIKGEVETTLEAIRFDADEREGEADNCPTCGLASCIGRFQDFDCVNQEYRA